MKVELNIPERICLLNIFPEKDSFENLCIIRDITSKLNFSSEEIEESQLKTQEKTITWKKDTKPKEFEFTSKDVTYINKLFADLSEKKELTLFHLATYEIFSKL